MKTCLECQHFSLKDAGAKWAELGMGVCHTDKSTEGKAKARFISHGAAACEKIVGAPEKTIELRKSFLNKGDEK